MSDRAIAKTYEVVIRVNTDQASEMKDGKLDWNAYPNWDINFKGNEEEFIDGLMESLESHNQYAGITVSVKQVAEMRSRG